jgi:hypothetical protein
MCMYSVHECVQKTRTFLSKYVLSIHVRAYVQAHTACPSCCICKSACPFRFGEISLKFRWNKPLFRLFISAKYFVSGEILEDRIAVVQTVSI